MKHLFSILAISLLLLSSCKEKIMVKLYPEKIITENFIGNGVQWDAYPHADSPDAEWGMLMTDSKWQMVFDRLDYMQPHFVRVLDQANWRYLKGFDKKGNAILNFDNPEEKALEKLLAYCQKNEIVVLLGEWGCPYQVHDTEDGFSNILKGANDPKWINMIVKHLNYLIIEKGFTCIRYFNLVNEPNGFWASTDGNWEEWSEGAKMLANAIKEAGIDQFVSVAGPDAVAHYDHPEYNLSGMDWVKKSAHELKDDLGALEIHAYFQKKVIREAQFDSLYKPLADIAKSLGKPIFFGEVGFDKAGSENQKRAEEEGHSSIDSYMGIYDYQHGIDMADAAIQIMATGFNGAAAWALDDAMHTNGDNGDKFNLKRWGMWNSLGNEICNNPDDENIRPWFFTWSLLCRYIQPGSQIFETDCSQKLGVRITAAQNGDELTVALVNQSENEQKIFIEIPKTFQGKTYQLFSYIEHHFLTDENGFPLAENENLRMSKNGIFTLILPAKSFKLITTYEY